MKHKTAIGAFSCTLSLTLFGPATEGYARSPGEQQASPEEQRAGRREIVTWATLYGFSLYGPGTIRLLDIESERRVAGVQMLMGGGSFFWALEATRDYRLGAGRSLLILGGSWAGTLYGLGVPVFFESENDKAYLAAAMIGTPAGGLMAYGFSSHRWFERGETDLMVAGGLAGGLYGVAIPYLLDIEDLDEWTQARIYVASAMAGGAGGGVGDNEVDARQTDRPGPGASPFAWGSRRRRLCERSSQSARRGEYASPCLCRHAGRAVGNVPRLPVDGRGEVHPGPGEMDHTRRLRGEPLRHRRCTGCRRRGPQTLRPGEHPRIRRGHLVRAPLHGETARVPSRTGSPCRCPPSGNW